MVYVGFRVYGLGFAVGFRVQGSGFRVQGLGFRMMGKGNRRSAKKGKVEEGEGLRKIRV